MYSKFRSFQFTFLLAFAPLIGLGAKISEGSPRIQPFIFPEKLTEGQKTKVLCSVVEGLGPFKFHWYKNDQPVQSISRSTIQNHDDYSALFINSLEPDHAGNYSCMVTSTLGKDSFSAELVVNPILDVPEAPAFNLVAASDSKIILRWSEPPSRTLPVTGYTLHYKKDGVEWYQIPINESSSKNRFTLTGLESSTPYKIYITASNQYGNGKPSKITTVTTSMKSNVIGETEPFVDLSVILPVAACILAFNVVTIVVIIYYKKYKARNSLERDKTRLPAEPGTLGSSYATIPPAEMIEEGDEGVHARIEQKNMMDRHTPS